MTEAGEDSRSSRLAGGYDIGNTDGPPDHPETGRSFGVALPFLCGSSYLCQLPQCGRPTPVDWGEVAEQAVTGAAVLGLALALGAVLRARNARDVVKKFQSRWLWSTDESWAGRTIAAVDPVDRWRPVTVAGLVFSSFLIASIPVQIRVASRDADGYVPPTAADLWLGLGTLGCLAPGLRESLRCRRYGATTLRFDGEAPRVGGRLLATVRVQRGLRAAARIDCALRCQRRQFALQEFGDNPDWVRTDTPIWTTRFQIAPWHVRTDNGELEIPIEIEIAPSSQPTDGSDWQDQVVWDLVLDSKQRLMDYRARIALPVHPPRGVPG